MLLRLHDSIDFDETWVKRSLARGSFGVFRYFWSEVILWSFGVTVERANFKQPSTTKLPMSMCWSRSTIKKCSWWPLCPTCGQGVKDQKSSNFVGWMQEGRKWHFWWKWVFDGTSTYRFIRTFCTIFKILSPVIFQNIKQNVFKKYHLRPFCTDICEKCRKCHLRPSCTNFW